MATPHTCSICGKAAVVRCASSVALCGEHYVARVHEIVKKTIKKYQMLTKTDKVLVAVSGGKDSLSLWRILLSLGYCTTGLYIDLGIRSYSKAAYNSCKQFVAMITKDYDTDLYVYDLKRETGKVLPEIARNSGRKICSTCGVVKRYLMNKVALDEGFSAVATGHTLDDEVAFLVSNLLRWDLTQLSRQYPVLQPWHPSLVKKVKPLCLLGDAEMKEYATAASIECYGGKCPYGERAFITGVKKLMQELEKRSPGIKKSFYQGFLENKYVFSQRAESAQALVREELKACKNCGMLTTREYCSFCKLVYNIRGE